MAIFHRSKPMPILFQRIMLTKTHKTLQWIADIPAKHMKQPIKIMYKLPKAMPNHKQLLTKFQIDKNKNMLTK